VTEGNAIMSSAQLNSLVIGRAAGTSFGVPESDLGRLSLVAFVTGNPILAIAAARSMANGDTKPSDEEEEGPDDAVDAAQAAADDAKAAKDAAELAEKAAETAQQEAVAAALNAKNAAAAAEKAAATAEQAASDAQKAAAEARDAAKSGVPVLAVKK
jgi:hypothetical protein